MKDAVESDPATTDDSLPSSGVRTVASLLLFIHLFCVLLSLTSNLSRSTLQSRLLRVLGPYTDLLNINLDFTPYYLTHGPQITVDDRIEVLPKGKDEAALDNWRKLPDVGSRGGERYKRYQRLAHVMAMRSQDDNMMSLMAADVSRSLVKYSQEPISQVRVRRHGVLYPKAYPPREGRVPDNENHPDLFQTAYAANVVITSSADIRLVKRTENRGHSAPASSSATGAATSGSRSPANQPATPTANPSANQPTNQ